MKQEKRSQITKAKNPEHVDHRRICTIGFTSRTHTLGHDPSTLPIPRRRITKDNLLPSTGYIPEYSLTKEKELQPTGKRETIEGGRSWPIYAR
jgi:hypothetical protein